MSDTGELSSRLSGAAVQREILAEALQHPATLYPFAVAAMAASYSIFMAPFLGGQPWALLLALGSGLGSVASFGWRYFVQGESAARVRAQQLVALEERRRRDAQEGELDGLREALAKVFRELASAQGQETLVRLSDEFGDVREALARANAPDPVAVARFMASARETYRGGLTALADARELMGALRGLDSRELEAEIAEGRAELLRLAQSGAEPERIRLKRRTLEERQRTLDLVERQSLALERLMHEADLASVALRRLRVALPTLDGPGADEALQEIGTPAERSAARPGRKPRRQTPVEQERPQRS